MPLWRTDDTATDGGKPKYLKTTEKKDTYATQSGWVYRHGGEYTDTHGKTRRKEEILVAKRQLAGANATHNLQVATITAAQFSAATADLSAVANVIVTFNEEVQVTGVPTLPVTSANTTANTVPATVTASYVSGNNTNRLYFNFTTDANAATYTIGSGANVTIANTQALQIVDRTDTDAAADLVIDSLYTGANSVIGTLTASDI